MNHKYHDADAYQVLGLSYSATAEEIQRVFHEKMQAGENMTELIEAYGKIRDQAGRDYYHFGKIDTYRLDPFINSKPSVSVDIEALAKELAFLTSWELGAER